MQYFFALIGVLVVGNFYMIFRRNKKNRSVGKEATANRVATVRRHDDLVRKLDHEQEEASKRVELQNKMFEMFQQVRDKHKDDTGASDPPSEKERSLAEEPESSKDPHSEDES